MTGINELIKYIISHIMEIKITNAGMAMERVCKVSEYYIIPIIVFCALNVTEQLYHAFFYYKLVFE